MPVTLVAAVHTPPELLPLPLPLPELLPEEVPLLETEPELLPPPELEPLLDDPGPLPELRPLDPPPPESAPDPEPPSTLVLSTVSRPVHAAPSASAAVIAIQCLTPGLDVMGFPVRITRVGHLPSIAMRP
jgi:hypothetical protein